MPVELVKQWRLKARWRPSTRPRADWRTRALISGDIHHRPLRPGCIDHLSGDTRRRRFLRYAGAHAGRLMHFFTHIDHERHMGQKSMRPFLPRTGIQIVQVSILAHRCERNRRRRFVGEPARIQSPRYLTNDEAAALSRLSPRTLEKQRVIGGGPRFRKFGRRVLYAIEDLEIWVNARACDMTSDPNCRNTRWKRP